MTMSDRPKKVALIGAYDRFNYGDLLFPMITSRMITSRFSNVDVGVFALRETDLSMYGALPTRPLREMFDGSFLSDGDVCIVNGGGVLGVDWVYIYANTLGAFGNANLYRAERLFGQRLMDRWVRRQFGGRSCAPFVIEPADFDQRVKVAYNAVGGGAEVGALPEPRRSAVLASLRNADFMSVRDDETLQLLGGLVPTAQAPDSAIVMSTCFPAEQLPAGMPDGAPYLCFQANADFGRRHQDNIVAMLENAYNATGLPALLLPIGRYVGLDDQQFLTDLSRRLRTPNRIFSDQATVLEIMGAIAHAALFFGTSLHGQVTSQSFGVPHLGLGLKNPKLVSYLRSWARPASSRCVDPLAVAEAQQAIDGVLAASASELAAHRERLIALALENFSRMFSAVGLQ